MILKISFIIPTLELGGAETMTVAMANELSKRNYTVSIIVLTDSNRLKNEVNPCVEVVYMGWKAFSTINKKSILQGFNKKHLLKSVFEKMQPNYIIASLPISHFISRLATNPNSSNQLWIYHHSTEYAINPVIGWQKKLIHFLQKRQGFKDSGHLFISKAVKKDIESNFPCNNGHVLYNAVQPNDIAEHCFGRVMHKYDLSPEFIILPGRLHAVKGHIFLLESLHESIKEHSIQLVFAGDGPEKESIEKVISKYELNDYVKLLGRVENTEMLALISKARFTIIPSLEEGLGNVAIEALMVGSTVLSSNAGGLPEVLEDGTVGYLFKKGDSVDLKRQFLKLWLDFDNYKINATRLKESYYGRFTIQAQIDRLMNILRNSI